MEKVAVLEILAVLTTFRLSIASADSVALRSPDPPEPPELPQWINPGRMVMH